MTNICQGCGITIQNSDKDKPGYATNLEFKYCKRCFRNMNYSETITNSLIYSNNEIISHINKKADFVFYVIDYLNLNNETINFYKNISVKKALIINKSDIIPKSVNINKFREYLTNEFDISEAIIFANSKYDEGINKIINIINKYKNVYFAGISNIGKSSLINSINKSITGEDLSIITSNMINSTMDFISVKINDSNIYDSPGFTYNTIIEEYKSLNKHFQIKKKINPRNFAIKENDIINIEDLIFLNFSDINNIVFYTSNTIRIKKFYNKINFINDVLVDDNTDLIIKGIGFINIKKKTKISLNIPNKYIETRKSIFRGKNI